MLLSAFYKLPELLTADLSAHANYESYLVNLYSMAILTELNSYNIPNPIELIALEKPYSNSPRNKVDLMVNFRDAFSLNIIEAYGLKPCNWIEVKYYSDLSRRTNKNMKGKASRVGALLNDIFRLCLYIAEEQGKHRNNGRLLLLVFNEEPQKYLAFSRKKIAVNRDWLSQLLDYKRPGLKSLSINLVDEVRSVTERILKGIKNIEISFKCAVNSFYPLGPTAINTKFIGFLINIFEYKIKYNGYEFDYDAFSKTGWSAEMIENSKSLVKQLERVDEGI